MKTATVRDRLAHVHSANQAPPQNQALQPQQVNLPQYVLDRQDKLRIFSESATQGPYHNLETSIATLQGTEASLRLCGDVIEGAVLSLGVQTAHHLLSNINEARAHIRTVEAQYRECEHVRKEEARLQQELHESLVSCHNSLREKSEAVEKEIRRLVEERDRKNSAADHAIQYIHSVVAERAVWQQRYGHNALDLPLAEATFAEQTVAALDALQQIRQLQMEGSLAPPLEKLPAAQATSPRPVTRNLAGATGSAAVRAAAPSRPSVSLLPSVSPSARKSESLANNASALEGRETAVPLVPFSVSFPQSRLFPVTGGEEVGMSAKDGSILARLRGLENTRHSAIAPYARLRYVPPRQEVELLREVLSMGTGSTTLMVDIENEQARLSRHKHQLREECGAVRRAMASLRQEVNTVRRFITDLVSQGLPFLGLKEDLMQPIQRRIERDARDMAQLWIADMAIDVDAAATGRYATADMAGFVAARVSGEERSCEGGSDELFHSASVDKVEDSSVLTQDDARVGGPRHVAAATGTQNSSAPFHALDAPPRHSKSPNPIQAAAARLLGEGLGVGQRQSFITTGDMAFSPPPVAFTEFGDRTNFVGSSAFGEAAP